MLTVNLGGSYSEAGAPSASSPPQQAAAADASKVATAQRDHDDSQPVSRTARSRPGQRPNGDWRSPEAEDVRSGALQRSRAAFTPVRDQGREKQPTPQPLLSHAAGAGCRFHFTGKVWSKGRLMHGRAWESQIQLRHLWSAFFLKLAQYAHVQALFNPIPLACTEVIHVGF